jgi:hypothetical protein
MIKALSPPSFVSSVPYEGARIYAAAVYCSDGRIGDHVDDFLHNGLGLPRYDRVACPGGPVALSGRFQAFWDARGVEEQLRFLAHANCAYYLTRLSIPPHGLEAAQREDLAKATTTIQRLMPTATVKRYRASLSGTEIRFDAA